MIATLFILFHILELVLWLAEEEIADLPCTRYAICSSIAKGNIDFLAYILRHIKVTRWLEYP